MTIADYFDSISETLAYVQPLSALVDSSVRFDRRPAEQGFVTGELLFQNGSALYFREFVDFSDGLHERLAYSFHYQDKNQNLICRYDNAAHRPPLPAREHKHLSDGSIRPAPPPSLLDAILEILKLENWLE